MGTDFELSLKNSDNKKIKIDINSGVWDIKTENVELTNFVNKPSQITRLTELVPKMAHLLATNGLTSIELKEK